MVQTTPTLICDPDRNDLQWVHRKFRLWWAITPRYTALFKRSFLGITRSTVCQEYIRQTITLLSPSKAFYIREAGSIISLLLMIDYDSTIVMSQQKSSHHISQSFFQSSNDIFISLNNCNLTYSLLSDKRVIYVVLSCCSRPASKFDVFCIQHFSSTCLRSKELIIWAFFACLWTWTILGILFQPLIKGFTPAWLLLTFSAILSKH